MKSFKNFIVEDVKNATLYHGTAFDNVHHILKAGHIDPSDEHGHTSTSRDHKTIEKTYGEEAYFKLDKNKIKHNQKVKPTDWHMGGSVKDKSPRHDDWARDHSSSRADSEELVKGKIHLKHATHVVVNKKHWDHFTGPETKEEKEASNHIKNDKETAWLFHGLTYKDRMKKVKEFHKDLNKHPHLKLQVTDY